MGILNPLVRVPRITWRKLEQLVEDVVYLEDGEAMRSWELHELTEQLARSILTEYVREQFDAQVEAVAKDMVRRRRDRRRYFEEEEM
ncbi:MAG: hypothetical protein K6T78_07890 [Alicyclobacillus sp.]|nr:hypothetical protein [Alicyclobacillus sp.]